MLSLMDGREQEEEHGIHVTRERDKREGRFVPGLSIRTALAYLNG